MVKKWICGLCALLMLTRGAWAESPDPERVYSIEHALYGLGFHGEDYDTVMDENTHAALRSFQIANNLPVTGEADEATLELLNRGTGVDCYAYLLNLASKYNDAPLLQLGSSGDDVLKLQIALQTLGYFEGSCDGVYGDATQVAICKFQEANGLTKTGTADGSTQMHLYEGSPISMETFLQRCIANSGESGQHVLRLQRKLQEMGYFKGETSAIYGEMTQQAVAAFQKNNALEETGIADLATCTLLFSGSAVAVRDTQTLNFGDSGDEVTELQKRLAALGYYDYGSTGIFGATTETAVRLFQMGNSLPFSGEVDETTRDLLWSDSAVTLEQVRDDFRSKISIQNETARDAIGNFALRSRGTSFESDVEDLYEGFAFVQYVCVAAGIPVVSPEDLIEIVNIPVESVNDLKGGELLLFQLENYEGGRMRFAISTGGNSMVYATHNSGWVLESSLESLDLADVYCWNMEAGDAQ